MERQNRVDEFYDLLEIVDSKFKVRSLHELKQGIILPKQGVYFFFDENQKRLDGKLKVIRVGTHAARQNSNTTLYRRLRQHQGTIKNKSGSHRSSIFRELVGRAIMQTTGSFIDSWGQKYIKTQLEESMEKEVTKYLSKQLFLVLEVQGESYKDNERAFIEKNAIGLLSNYQRKEIDPVNSLWLGKDCGVSKVSKSDLWNSDHVELKEADDFISRFQNQVDRMKQY